MCKHLLKIQRLILALLIFGGGIFYASSATARVCFLPDSTDCGEGDVDVPEVQITCATYGGYETEAACLEARTNKTAQTCTLNSGCYYPKCAYDSERKCKNENPDKKCLSQDVDGVKCWYSQPKTCSEQGYKNTPCATDEDSGTVPNTLEASDGPCYKCTPKKECKYISNLYYGPKDTCPQYTDRKDAGVTGKDGVCSTCEPQACSAINAAYKNAANQNTCGSNKEAKKVEGTDSAADGPCYTCEDKPVGCTYEYRQATKNDSCGSSEVIGSDDSCVYALLSKVKSVYFIGQSRDYKSGSSTLKSYLVNVAINRISNTSATCVDENKVTKYQTICEGTPESLCKNEGDEFIPNGCVSDTYNNGFEVKGDKWGTCKKANICKYEFTQLTTLDTHSISKFNPNDINAYDYDKIRDLYGRFQSQSIKSALYYVIDEKDYHLFNKISKDSKTCYDDNHQLRYETICTDTSKQYCDTKKGRIFTRTCTSEGYNVKKLKVESMEFGTCECDLDRRFYKTEDDCLKANESQSLKCTKRDSNWCYQTCEDAGMYSSEDACMTDTKEYSVKCTKVGNCYKQEMYGFLIKIDEHTIRSFSCRHPSNPGYSMSTYAYLSDIRDDDFPGGPAKTVKGEDGRSLDDSLQQFPAGTYYLCFRTHTSGQYGGYSPTPSLKTVYVDIYPAMVDTIIDFDKTPLRDGCAKVKFEAGTTYSVQFSYTGVPQGDVTCTGN